MLLLSSPNMGGNELKYVTECITTGWVSSVGAFVNKFEEVTAEFTGASYAVATSSGTTALHTALVMLGVNHNDLVIVPNITFIASVNSIKYTGASPVLIDVNKDDWQMDLDLLEEFLKKETEVRNETCYHIKSGKRIPVIIPVHVLGNMCDMERLMELATQYHLAVLEDSTEALGSFFNGKHAGTFGLMGTFSYNGNKIITTGGGGMIVTNDEALAKRAKHLTTQAKADPFEYFHDETGYNYRLVNVAAAMGVAQMEQLPDFLKRKKEIIAFYKKELEGVGDISFQKVDARVNPNWWMPTIATEKQRIILEALNSNKMQSRPLWIPMNRLPMFKDDIYYQHSDISWFLYERCLSIPCSTNITDDDLRAVSDKIKGCFSK
ncbi:MAG: LegC family aminotransferase [Chitinophagaceae bacterium]|nr:LegC family aminotransferase [Chitinophagaceae bacterium]